MEQVLTRQQLLTTLRTILYKPNGVNPLVADEYIFDDLQSTIGITKDSLNVLVDGKTITMHSDTLIWVYLIQLALKAANPDLSNIVNTDIQVDLRNEEEILSDGGVALNGAYQQLSVSYFEKLLTASGSNFLPSLNLFGITVVESKGQPGHPLVNSLSRKLYFDTSTRQITAGISDIADVLSSYPNLAGTLYLYLPNLNTNNIDIISLNEQLAGKNVIVANAYTSTISIALEMPDNIHRFTSDEIKRMFHSISEGTNNESFSDLIKLYSLLDNCDAKDIELDYRDFFYQTIDDMKGLSKSHLRVLALFHLQHPEKVLNLANAGASSSEAIYLNYLANLSDRQEGTISDKLDAFLYKCENDIGKMFVTDFGAQRFMFSQLNDCKLSDTENNILPCLAVALEDLQAAMRYNENRISVTPLNIPGKQASTSYVLNPLHYGENPFDYRPDFTCDALGVIPTAFNFYLKSSELYIGTSVENINSVKILSVVDTLLESDFLKDFISANILEYADYSFPLDVNVDNGIVNLDSLYCNAHYYAERNGAKVAKDINEQTMARTLHEMAFIVKSFVHRVLRYFEQHLSSDTAITPRILNITDLVCFKCKDKIYLGVTDIFNPVYTVTPYASLVKLSRALTSSEEASADLVFKLPQRNVNNIIPTSAFNMPDQTPIVLKSIFLSLQRSDIAYADKEYKDCITYGWKFDSWTEFFVLHSCGAAGKSAKRIEQFFKLSQKNVPTFGVGCASAIHAAFTKYKLGLIDESKYKSILVEYSKLFVTGVMQIPMYSVDIANERDTVCNSKELWNLIDFNYFKDVRMQYSPISIFGSFNREDKNVTWHTTLLKESL